MQKFHSLKDGEYFIYDGNLWVKLQELKINILEQGIYTSYNCALCNGKTKTLSYCGLYIDVYKIQ